MVEIQIREGTDGIQAYVRTAEDELIAKAIAVLTSRLQAGTLFTSPALVRQYLQLRLGREVKEVFGAMWLNSENRVIKDEVLFTGTLSSCSVYPRELVKSALLLNAGACILYHNHPSGSNTPSEADKMLTQTLKTALRLVDVNVIDHLIVSRAGTTSFAEIGLL